MRVYLSFWKKVSKDAKLFVQLHVLFGGLVSVLNLFVNTFLLKAYGSFSAEVLLYNGIMAVAQPVAMMTAMKITTMRDALFAQRLGFVFYGLALTVLCIFGDKVSSLYPLFAVMISFGAGYYYSTYSAQMLTYTSDGTRDMISAVMSLFGATIAVILPLISGFLITVFDAYVGYRITFGLAALLAGAAWLTTKYLPDLPKHKKEQNIWYVTKVILSDKNGISIMVANGLVNCIGFTLPIFVTLLFYNLVPNELLISVNSTLGSVVGFLAAGVYGYIITSRNRVKAGVIATAVMLLPCAVMLLELNIFAIMLFQVVFMFCWPFVSTPASNVHFRVMEDLGFHGAHGVEVHLLREFFVSLGRILGLVLVWLAPQTNEGAVFVILCMMGMAAIDAWILWKIGKRQTVPQIDRA